MGHSNPYKQYLTDESSGLAFHNQLWVAWEDGNIAATEDKVELIEDALDEFANLTCHCERQIVWSDFADRNDILEWLSERGT